MKIKTLEKIENISSAICMTFLLGTGTSFLPIVFSEIYSSLTGNRSSCENNLYIGYGIGFGVSLLSFIPNAFSSSKLTPFKKRTEQEIFDGQKEIGKLKKERLKSKLMSLANFPDEDSLKARWKLEDEYGTGDYLIAMDTLNENGFDI